MGKPQGSAQAGRFGRPKKGGEYWREANGRRQRVREVVPMQAVAQRVKGLGIGAPVSPVAAALLCRDHEAGTALGRVMWVYAADGSRKRRMMADGQAPVITDAMRAGADVVRAAWAAWSRASGLPCRNPRAIGLGVVGGASEPVSVDQAEEAADRWRRVTMALMGCKAPLLVWAAVESVVIDDVAAGILQRPAALAALRRGLVAVGVL